MSNRDCKLPFRQLVDPIEANLRDRAREFLQAMLEAELEEALAARAMLVVRCEQASLEMWILGPPLPMGFST